MKAKESQTPAPADNLPTWSVEHPDREREYWQNLGKSVPATIECAELQMCGVYDDDPNNTMHHDQGCPAYQAPADEIPWCEPCGSYHPAPKDAEHKAALGCVAPTDSASSKCEHGVLWSMECIACPPQEYVAAARSAEKE